MSKHKVLDIIQQRRSVRKFSDRPVQRELLLTCIEAARLAPSAENRQPWRFIILDDPGVRTEFCTAAFSGIYRATRWAQTAPVIVIVLAELDFITHKLGNALQGTPYHYIDIGITGEHFVLQAQALGLSTCWIGWFNLKRAKKFLKLPSGMKLCQLIAVGYAETAKPHRIRKLRDTESIVSFNRWDPDSREPDS